MKRTTNPLIFAAAICAVAFGAWLQRRESVPASPPDHKWTRVDQVAQYPPERAELMATLELIERDGPFPYRQDGGTFANRGNQLPAQEPGYYREYTVPTPASPDRGARRVIRGRGGETYYTRDHYRTFIRIDR